MMKRRKFLQIGGLALVAFFISMPIVISFNGALKKVLHSDLNYLKFSNEMINTFIDDSNQVNMWGMFDLTKRLMIIAFTYFGFLPLPYRAKYEQYRSQMVANFLLSTDFFMYGMDESRELNYIGIYNPFARPCSNPFSALYYPDPSI